MKKILFLSLGVLFGGSLSAQVIMSGVSPTSIQDNYEITYNTDWNANYDAADPANAVLDTLVLYDDVDNLGCQVAGNAAELDGKIAILYRKDCEFGLKALNAQNAGAIAVVIINNVSGSPVGMAGGTSGSTVAIPVVMITQEAGNQLVSAMETDDVVVFIGNKQGYFDADIGMKGERILRPYYSSYLESLANTGDGYELELGGWVYNYGADDQVDIEFNVTIDFEGTEIYNESDTVALNSGDSVWVDLPSYQSSSWDVGYYSLTYSTNLPDAIEDEYDFDNTINSDFVISETDVAFASIDPVTMLPRSSGGTRPVDQSGNPIAHYSACILFQDENASQLAPSGLSFSAIKGSDSNSPSMEGEEIMIQVFEYNDAFTTLDPLVPNGINDFNELMVDSYYYEEDLDEVVTALFSYNEITALEDDQRYLFCATTMNPEVYIGSDSQIDYSTNILEYGQPLFPVEAGSSQFNANGFGILPTSTPAIAITFIPAEQVGLVKEDLAIEMKAYPSPASEVLTIDFNQNEVNKVELVNMTGQTVIVENVNKADASVTLDVNGIDSGVYIVKVHLENNYIKTMNVVVNH